MDTKNKSTIIILLIIFLIPLLLISCIPNISSAIHTTKMTEKIKTTIDVKYIVSGVDTNNVFITYTNSQGGTEQISNKKLNSTLEEVFAGTNYEPEIKNITNYEENKERFKASVIAHYDEFPINEFMYLSAQNNSSYGMILVHIVVDNMLWKFSKAEGAYAIAEINGYYN